MSESKFLLIKKEEFNILLKNMEIIKENLKQEILNPRIDSVELKLEHDYNDMIYRSRIFILETIISMIMDIKNFKMKRDIMITSQFYDIIDNNKKKELDNLQETELLNHIKKLLSISINLRELYGSGKIINETQQKLVSHIYMIKLFVENSYLLKNNLIKSIINFN
jgi:hypothetical protein